VLSVLQWPKSFKRSRVMPEETSPGLSLSGDDYQLYWRVLNNQYGGIKIASALSSAIESAESTGEGLIVGAAPHEQACILRHAAALKIDLEKKGVRFVD